MGAGFPGEIGLAPAKDSGAAFWIPEPRDDHGIWRMFQGNAYWKRDPADSIQIIFSNGFSAAGLEVVLSADSLNGRATWYSDVVSDGPPPSAAARGNRVPCSELLAK